MKSALDDGSFATNDGSRRKRMSESSQTSQGVVSSD
jgi:hypothetical protein